ncbi:MAG: CoA-binding protein [Chloroflexi bacterium]|nr:CoA-binding protein [Chloroflexota bacterium]
MIIRPVEAVSLPSTSTALAVSIAILSSSLIGYPSRIRSSRAPFVEGDGGLGERSTIVYQLAPEHEALGEKSYPNLKSVPEEVDIVDIFRRSELVGQVVDEAIEAGARYIWVQDGVVDDAAAARARAAGIPVVMDS